MRKGFLVTIYLSFLILAGCTKEMNSANDWIENYVIQASGIEESQEYQRYIELNNNGKLNQAGEYNGLDHKEYQTVPHEEAKQVRVTIAQNSFLKIDYYYDAECKEKVDQDTVFLNPGDKLFCSRPQSDNVHSNTYVFSGFQIYEFDEDGNKGRLWDTTEQDNVALVIPVDFKGTELSVMPIGIYEKRNLTFRAFYYNENGEIRNVPGVWFINDEVCTDTTGIVGAGDVYTIKYQYDEEAYYYVNADPLPFILDVPGMVEFKKATPLSEDDNYSVQLHKWITAMFSYDNNEKNGIASIEKNGKPIQDFDNKELKKLKGGDKLSITTNENYRVFCRGILIDEPEMVDGGFRYTMTIPESNEFEYIIKISKSELQVSLDDSVGYDMAFDIITSGVSKKNCYYSKQALNGDLVIFNDTIGLEENITIEVKEAEIKPGNAIKIAVNKIDGNSQTSTEIKYILTTPGLARIDLYNGVGETANLNKIYKKIKIQASMVQIMEYSPTIIPNASINVKLADGTSRELLKEGDVVEGDTKVEVSIYPESGYYVAGKDVTDDVYVKNMKYSRYESDIDTIIKDHEIKKLYSVTLDDTDSYGMVTYKLNGREAVGTIEVREEDELIIEYKLTDESYEIIRNSEGFWNRLDDWSKNVISPNKEEITVQLSDAIDGMTINRSDFIEISAKTGEE